LIKRIVNKAKQIIIEHPAFIKLIALLRAYKPYAFKGNSLYEVGSFFIKAMRNEDIHLRASSLAYSFFLSIFPLLLFLLTLIAYLPGESLKNQIIMDMELFLPKSSFSAISSTVTDIIKNQRHGLLSIGLLAAVYFSSNGMLTLINSLNRNVSNKIARSLVQKRLLAIGLTFFVILLLIITGAVLLFFDYTRANLMKQAFIPDLLIQIVFFLAEVLVLMGALFVIISSIYYYSPASKKTFRFISPGSILATILIILTTLILQYYINNIHTYNKIYGSIGAVIALLIILYFNSNCILIGFELNRSIDKAKNEKLESRPFILKNL